MDAIAHRPCHTVVDHDIVAVIQRWRHRIAIYLNKRELGWVQPLLAQPFFIKTNLTGKRFMIRDGPRTGRRANSKFWDEANAGFGRIPRWSAQYIFCDAEIARQYATLHLRQFFRGAAFYKLLNICWISADELGQAREIIAILHNQALQNCSGFFLHDHPSGLIGNFLDM